MTPKHLLLIDDDRELVELLSELLQSEGFAISCAFDGEQGLQQIQQQQFDIILLDIMMPKVNGLDVLRALGGRHQTPILMLTAKGDDTDRVLGLELGADDYLAKPYNPNELLARIRAILRRVDIINNKNKQLNIELNQVQIKGASREVLCQQQQVVLTGTEYEILHLLMSSPDSIISKEQISEQILGRPLAAFDRSIDMHLSNIRRKLQQFADDEKIKTIRGVGYVFISGDQ
ncbi:response regulator transcription factor [Thalassotalea sp. Y01]|uniref:response regulator transcription factor n=1 Tax=Thalassotalea sp. Y01 TaxID=2729613 RepID=UPI00145EC670|nr:response regulator transcription factor [Thalassotalea sp. Y01]NMP16984.1 response regulator transcription factor [Thalassotalea sp. Y01]